MLLSCEHCRNLNYRLLPTTECICFVLMFSHVSITGSVKWLKVFSNCFIPSALGSRMLLYSDSFIRQVKPQKTSLQLVLELDVCNLIFERERLLQSWGSRSGDWLCRKCSEVGCWDFLVRRPFSQPRTEHWWERASRNCYLQKIPFKSVRGSVLSLECKNYRDVTGLCMRSWRENNNYILRGPQYFDIFWFFVDHNLHL